VGGGRRSRPLPKDRHRLPSRSDRGRRSGPCGPALARRSGLPEGAPTFARAPRVDPGCQFPRKRGTGLVRIPWRGLDEIRAHSGREKPHRSGALETLLPPSGFDASRHCSAGLTSAERAPRGRKPRRGWVPAPLLRRTLAGRFAGALRTALRRSGGLLRGRVYDARVRGFPREAPVCNSTEAEEHRGREMGAPSSPGRNSERDPGTLAERLPSRGGLAEAGLHRAVNRHQDDRVGASEVLRARRAVPCGAGCRAGSCEPAAEARLPDYRPIRGPAGSARDRATRGWRVRIPWRTRPAQ